MSSVREGRLLADRQLAWFGLSSALISLSPFPSSLMFLYSLCNKHLVFTSQLPSPLPKGEDTNEKRRPRDHGP